MRNLPPTAMFLGVCWALCGEMCAGYTGLLQPRVCACRCIHLCVYTVRPELQLHVRRMREYACVCADTRVYVRAAPLTAVS